MCWKVLFQLQNILSATDQNVQNKAFQPWAGVQGKCTGQVYRVWIDLLLVMALLVILKFHENNVNSLQPIYISLYTCMITPS